MGTLLQDRGKDYGFHGVKVLLVDDDVILRECISEVLFAVGFDVIEAKDGLEALRKYEAQRGAVALVIMDISMPRLDGIKATRKIREIDPFAKIILSSGRADPLPPDVVPDALLPKPYTLSALREVVKQVLQRSHGLGDGLEQAPLVGTPGPFLELNTRPSATS